MNTAAALAGLALAVTAVISAWIWWRYGYRLADRLGGGLGLLVGSWLRVRRTHVDEAMARAGMSAGSAQAMYRTLGRHLLQVLWSFGQRRNALARHVEHHAPLELWLRQHGGAGVVVATAHTGNWDFCACAFAERQRLTVVTKHLSVGWIDRFWQKLRRDRRVRLLSQGSVMRGARESLTGGGALAMIVDQRPNRVRGTVSTDFLGARCDVDLAPALIAMRFRVPLVAVFPTTLGAKHGLAWCGSWMPPSTPSRTWAEEVMVAVTQALEQQIRQRPAEWLWMHRRWVRAVDATQDMAGGPAMLAPNG